jgi:hypothetical protein
MIHYLCDLCVFAVKVLYPASVRNALSAYIEHI